MYSFKAFVIGAYPSCKGIKSFDGGSFESYLYQDFLDEKFDINLFSKKSVVLAKKTKLSNIRSLGGEYVFDLVSLFIVEEVFSFEEEDSLENGLCYLYRDTAGDNHFLDMYEKKSLILP